MAFWFVFPQPQPSSVIFNVPPFPDKPSYDLRKPVFVDAADPSQFLTGLQLRSIAKCLARGLRDRAGIREGDAVLICAPNSVRRLLHAVIASSYVPLKIYYPAFYLGAVCAGAIFTGANPAYGEIGMPSEPSDRNMLQG